jgi:hypothetical protein
MNPENEIAALSRMTTKQLKARFAELTGDSTAANNRPWLIKRIAWRIQALAHGGLTPRALDRAEELANDADRKIPRALGLRSRPAKRWPRSRPPPPSLLVTHVGFAAAIPPVPSVAGSPLRPSARPTRAETPWLAYRSMMPPLAAGMGRLGRSTACVSAPRSCRRHGRRRVSKSNGFPAARPFEVSGAAGGPRAWRSPSGTAV